MRTPPQHHSTAPHAADGHEGMHVRSWELAQKEGEGGKKQGKLFTGQVKVRIGEQILDKGSSLP